MSLGNVLKSITHIVTKNKIATVVVIIAVFLRFYRLEEFVTFLGDQGRDAIIIKRMVTFEHFTAIGPPSSIGQVFLGPFFYYLMIPFLFLAKLNPIGMTIGVALLSVIGLILSYFVVKKYTDAKIALIFIILVAFSLVNIELARFAWNPNLLPVAAFLSLYFFHKMRSDRSIVFAALTGIFLSISFQLHHLGALLIIPISIMGIATLIHEKKKSLFLKNTGIAITAFIIMLAPLILFDFKHDFLNTNTLIRFFTTSQSVVATEPYLQRLLFTNRQFYTHLLRVPFGYEYSYPLLLLSLGMFGLTLKVKQLKENEFLKLHAWSFILFLVLFGLLNSPRHPHYFGVIYYSFFLMTATYLGTFLTKSTLRTMVLIVLLVIYISLNAKGYFFFNKEGNQQLSRAKKIAESIIAKNPKDPFQLSNIPSTSVDGHIRYYLEILNHKPLPEDSSLQPEEIYVLCYTEPCSVLSDGQWQLAAFQNKKIDTMWNFQEVKIFKVVHEK